MLTSEIPIDVRFFHGHSEFVVGGLADALLRFVK